VQARDGEWTMRIFTHRVRKFPHCPDRTSACVVGSTASKQERAEREGQECGRGRDRGEAEVHITIAGAVCSGVRVGLHSWIPIDVKGLASGKHQRALGGEGARLRAANRRRRLSNDLEEVVATWPSFQRDIVQAPHVPGGQIVRVRGIDAQDAVDSNCEVYATRRAGQGIEPAVQRAVRKGQVEGAAIALPSEVVNGSGGGPGKLTQMRHLKRVLYRVRGLPCGGGRRKDSSFEHPMIDKEARVCDFCATSEKSEERSDKGRKRLCVAAGHDYSPKSVYRADVEK
jgi:hypothetical protein